MAHMGLRLGQRANGVAKLHGVVSREMFAGLWPGFDFGEVPIASVTNGVHLPTWAAREMYDVAGKQSAPTRPRARRRLAEVGHDPRERLWDIRRQHARAAGHGGPPPDA